MLLPRHVNLLLLWLFVLSLAGCHDQTSVSTPGREYQVFPLSFSTVRTIDQASAFFDAPPIGQEGESVTWQVPDGPTMTFLIGVDGFVRTGTETNPQPVFEPPIKDSAQAKAAFGRAPDRVVANKSLEMNIESYEVNEFYDISFGFKSDGKLDVLIGGTTVAKDAVGKVDASIGDAATSEESE